MFNMVQFSDFITIMYIYVCVCMFVCPKHMNYSVTKNVNNPSASLMFIQDPNFAITVDSKSYVQVNKPYESNNQVLHRS